MEKEELDQLWADEKNWTGLNFYKCSADPRLIVPKKKLKWLGWTPNIAHRSALVMSALLGVLAIALPLLTIFFIDQSITSLLIAVMLSLILMSGAGFYFSSRTG